MNIFANKLLSIYIISLRHRNDRREALTSNLNSLGFELSNFNIFDAIKDTNFGGLGCAKSHLYSISHFISNSSNQFCCILEDDFEFNYTQEELDNLLNNLNSNFNWDVFLLSGTNVIPFTTNNTAIIKVFESQSTSGYIFKRNYAKKLINIFIDSISEMEKYRDVHPRDLIYSRFAIDQMWKLLQHSDNWFCTIPMAGQQTASFSDIENQLVNYQSISS